ncbi:MAG: class I SAM-dependent RNA methyltransferase [Deltaproteobacteria bacterium]|nr:class I SAM-dependent RNA methyltransferase [Deltaproteobacteria bacterium]
MVGSVHALTILDLIAGGRGRAELNGVQVFVDGAAPGDHAQVRITKQHAHYWEGVVETVLTPSSERTVPQCPAFGRCGGCQWQHLRYEAQVAWKQRILAEQLRWIGKLRDPVVLPTIPAPSPWHYRSRIKLQIDDAGRIGFFRAGTYEAVEFEHCWIADERINTQLAANKATLRASGRGRLVQSDADADGGFAQVNPAQNAQLQQLVVEGVRAHGGGRVLELYCGNGNLTFFLAGITTAIVGIETHAASIRQAQQQAAARGHPHLDFRCTAAHRFLRHAAKQATRFDGILLDPPRRGAAEAIPGIIACAPRWIGYISCDPATLARDLRALIAAGYHHESSQPIDMFPQTFHIESVTWLRLGTQADHPA